MKFLLALAFAPLGYTFRVATYNVYNYDDGGEWGDRQNWIRDNIVAANPDFLAVQEVRMDNLCQSFNVWPFCNSNMFSDLQSLLEPLGYTNNGYRGAMDHSGSLEGLAYFSKYDITTVTDADISSGESDDLNNRIVVNILAQVDGRPVNFFNTHWSYASAERPNNANGVIRFVRETAANQAGQSTPFTAIVLGDLNTYSSSFDGLNNQGVPFDGSDVFFRDTYNGGGNTYCNCKLNGDACSLNGRLDYIAVQNTAGVSVGSTGTVTHPSYPSVCASDHRLYYADITLN